MSTLIQKQDSDFSSEELILHSLILSEAKLVDRTAQNKSNLIFLTFVGGKFYTPITSKLYFGDLQESELNQMRGQKVDVAMGLGEKDFHIKKIRLASPLK